MALITFSASPAFTQSKPLVLSGHLQPTDSSVWVGFSRPLVESELEHLERHGVEFVRRSNGDVVAVGAVYHTLLRAQGLESLATFHLTRRVEPARNSGILFPAELTLVAANIDPIHKYPWAGQLGHGQTIATLDSGVDVLHPHLFHADGGFFSWIDADRDGAFTPGVDSVDYNDNGEADFGEVSFVLDGADLPTFNGTVENVDEVLDPQRDWVFVDYNGDGVRNVGVEDGFTEEDPGYGEPLFVVDDVNSNGRLDPLEKLVLLRTSKIQKIRDGELEFVRGLNLIESRQADNFGFSFHGTGVASILVGGQPGFRARQGVAPQADLLVYVVQGGFQGSFLNESSHLEYIDDAMNAGASVILHEWTSPYTTPHDGSSLIENAMDTARAERVSQVTPVGNLNTSQKHVEAVVLASGELEVSFEVGEGWRVADTTKPYEDIYGSLMWRAADLTLVLESPDASVPVPTSGTPVDISGGRVSATLDVTSRGTHHVMFHIQKDGGLDPGTWTWRVAGATADTPIVGRISDVFSGWGVGVFWSNSTRDHGTVAHPSTADSAFGVAAFGVRAEDDEVREFSGRGPRIDGAAVVDIAAPDDPFAAIASTDEVLDSGVGNSWFTVFGGTSGAAPHVAGVFALLRERSPRLTVEEMESEIVGAASAEGIDVELPNNVWGHGRLDAYRALFGSDAGLFDNAAPEASLSIEPGGLSAADSIDPDDDRLQFRFDADYDGVWETEWQLQPVYRGQVGEVAKVQIRDLYGVIDGALATTDVPDPPDMGSPDMGPPETPTPPDCECSQLGQRYSPTSMWFGFLLLILGLTFAGRGEFFDRS